MCRRIINRRRCVPGHVMNGQVFGSVDDQGSHSCGHHESLVFSSSSSWISSCAHLWSSTLQVKVPPLGESITDGTVAAILKQEGDHVEEDDSLIQIETDKVTVDVRTPVAGIVKSVLVSTDDTVAVDHVVAVITEGEAPGRVESVGDVSQLQVKEVRVGDPAPKEVQQAGVTLQHGRAHVPLISFPPRRTADGTMISDLSEAEQERIRKGSVVDSASFFVRNMPRIEQESLPPRRILSEKEMEMIMLGGAE